jgi:hypothetical protein
MRRKLSCVIALGSVVTAASVLRGATIYTSDSNLADFTSRVLAYATLSNFSLGDVSSPFTPTSSELATNGFRAYSGGSLAGLPTNNNWILATFSRPVRELLVFPNIDHFGSAYDGLQYTIQGSNDLATWTPLFDALTVNGPGEPFTLGTFTGTAPISVNNVLTPGAGPNGTVGYEARFNFDAAYQYYAFGASSEAVSAGNTDQELSAVASVSNPEPVSFVLFGSGLLGLAAFAGRKRLARPRRN